MVTIGLVVVGNEEHIRITAMVLVGIIIVSNGVDWVVISLVEDVVRHEESSQQIVSYGLLPKTRISCKMSFRVTRAVSNMDDRIPLVVTRSEDKGVIVGV